MIEIGKSTTESNPQIIDILGSHYELKDNPRGKTHAQPCGFLHPYPGGKCGGVFWLKKYGNAAPAMYGKLHGTSVVISMDDTSFRVWTKEENKETLEIQTFKHRPKESKL